MTQIGESVATARGSSGAESEGDDEDDDEDRTIVKVLLHDVHVEPMPRAWYLLRAAGEERRARARDDGILVERFSNPVEECRVFWSPGEDPQPGGENDFRYGMTVYTHIADGDPAERERKLLNNLGYPYEASESEKKDACLRSFRSGWRIRKLRDGILRSVHRRERIKPTP
jgi:hypothetical protein